MPNFKSQLDGWNKSLRGGEHFPDPFCDMASTQMPDQHRNVLDWCLVPGSLIELAGLQFKSVEAVVPGDIVPTRGGTLERVLALGQRQVDENIVEVFFAGLGRETLKLTGNHKLYRIRTAKLKPGRVRPEEKQAEEVRADELEVGNWIATPLPVRGTRRVSRFHGYILGMYVAEGCCVRDEDRTMCSRFSLGYEDEDTGVLAELLKELSLGVGKEVLPYTPPTRPDVRIVTVSDPELPDWLKQQAGELAQHKSLSPEILRFADKTLLAILAGWLDGDGWILRKADRFAGLAAETSSKILAYQLLRVANCVGLTPSLFKVRSDRGYNAGNANAYAWRLTFGKADSQHFLPYSVKARIARQEFGEAFLPQQEGPRNVFIAQGYVYRRIQKIGRPHYQGPVYNFEVENDHSYIVQGICARNCEFIFMSNGTYRMAMERIVSYFLTDIEIGSPGDDTIGEDEKEKYSTSLKDTLDGLCVIQSLTRDRMCFHGDVRAVTRNGIFSLRELAGRTVEVLSEGGEYRPATFETFGKQELLEVKFSDGRTLLATPEHQWVAKNCSDKTVRVPTTSLGRGYCIERTVAPRPPQNEDFFEGVRHGFVFGDGSRYNSQSTGKPVSTEATFFGPKDEALLPYFKGHGGEPKLHPDRTRIFGLPVHYKSLPVNEASASYWYGFVCGFLAAAGSVDVYGCAILTQVAEATLEAIIAQLPRIGMAAGPLRSQRRTTDLREYNGNPDAVYDSTIYFVTLLKRFMLPQDFLLPAHRENFERNWNPRSTYGKYVGIKSVKPTGLYAEVFCCVEPETHTFVVDQAILTGNCYGNSFASVVVPFHRFVVCPRCGNQHPIRVVYENKKFAWQWKNCEPYATCQNKECGRTGKWKFNDVPNTEDNKIRVKRWNPKEIEILHDYYSDETAYLWRIPEDYRNKVLKGELFELERVPQQMLLAIKNRQLFRFADDAIFHMKEPTLAGIRARGWGISRVLTNFRQAWYVQVLRRYNEAIALDYVIPFRVLTPADKSGNGMSDPLMSIGGGNMQGQLNTMLAKRRKDPAAWHTLSFPITYQALGGEATALAPKDLLDQGQQTLLNEAGTPVELYQGTLTLQTAPVALRLFESTWQHLVHDNDRFLTWLVKQLSQILSWEVVTAKLRRVTYADDMSRQMAALQLAMGQQISQTTALKGMGFSWRDEQRQIAEEAMFQSEQTARTQEEMQQAAFGQQMAKGQPPGGAAGGAPGGAPPPAGDPSQGGGDPSQGGGQPAGPVTGMLQSGSSPTTPQDMLAQADSLSQQLLGLPSGQVRSELAELKKKNEALYGLVKEKMNQYRSQARTAGGAQVMAQNFGQGGQGGGQ